MGALAAFARAHRALSASEIVAHRAAFLVSAGACKIRSNARQSFSAAAILPGIELRVGRNSNFRIGGPKLEAVPDLDLANPRSSANERLALEPALGYPSRVEIDLGALAANVRWIKSKAGGAAVMAVVKANAYGHGAAAVARTALQNGAELLAAANVGEALELREAGIDAPILILSYVADEAISLAIKHDLSLSVFDESSAERIIAAACGADATLKVHIKVDTGMGRLGALPRAITAIGSQLRDADEIVLEGVYTHFATADDDLSFMNDQLHTFYGVLSRLRGSGIKAKFIHAANSAALLNGCGSVFSVVRPGVLLYGLEPMPDSGIAKCLKPVMSWKTQIAQVKSLPPGSPVGYGKSYRTRGRETLAVAPVGYADGLRRTPLSWREVLIRGRRAPIVGRVSMEKITVNVSKIPGARAGDEVVLLGPQGADRISAEEIAAWIQSNNYEVVASIAPRAPRCFVNL